MRPVHLDVLNHTLPDLINSLTTNPTAAVGLFEIIQADARTPAFQRRSFYQFFKAKDIAGRLVCEVVRPLVADLARLTLAIDDTPTRRYERKGQSLQPEIGRPRLNQRRAL